MEDHEDPEREQRDSAFDTDPEAERKMDERWAEMAARAGAPNPRATDVLNRIIASKRFAAPVAAAAVSTMLRRPRLATQFYRHASSTATATNYARYSQSQRQFSTRVDHKFEQPLAGGELIIGDTPGMEFAKKAVHYSFWYFLGAEGDKYIRAAGNALLEALERNAKEWEPSKWGPPFLAGSRKEPVLGDGQDTDPEVDANVKQLYKDWYTQPESAFWKGYAQIISSTSMPLDGQFVALSLMSHLLPITEIYYWPSQDDALALLEACAQAVKAAGGKASAIYTCLAEHVDALKLPRSIAIDIAQMVVSTLIQPAAPGSPALHTAGLKSLGADPPVADAIFAFLENVSFMIPQVGALVAGTLTFFQIMFPTKHDNGLALVKAFISAVDHLLDLHDIKDMRNEISTLTATYQGVANALSNYSSLTHKELPQAELKTPGTAAYETIMTPLIEVCAGAEPKGLNYIVYTLINDDRYKMDCIPLAAAATTLWVAYHALYMQMCSYRDGQVSDDEALTYGKVRDFLLDNVPKLKDNVAAFKAARLGHVSQVQHHSQRAGVGRASHDIAEIMDDAGSDAIPPGFGAYKLVTRDPSHSHDLVAHVSSKRDLWLASINKALDDWATKTVEDPADKWMDKFVYQNSPYFYPPDPSPAPQVVPGTGQELTGGPVFDRWHACDTVTYAITFKNDRGESKRVESAAMKVEKVQAPAVVKNATPDLTVPCVDDVRRNIMRLVYIKFDNGDWEPVPSAIAQLATDPKATRVSTK